MKSGQILILVLLIVVVSLAVGLSVASRNLTNLKISTQTQESQRAFSAAEGGVEDVLSRLNTIKQDSQVLNPGGLDVPVAVGDISATVNVKGRNVYTVQEVKLGDVAQVTLVHPGPPPTYYLGILTIQWPKDPHVSLEVTLICENAAPANNCLSADTQNGTYEQNRYAFQGPNPPSDQSATSPYTWQDCNVTGDTCSVNIDLRTAGTNPKILRIKPFHKKVIDLTVSGSPALPTQIYEINSVAKTELGITRRVQVTRTALPALPAVFDYVLYSEGDIVK